MSALRKKSLHVVLIFFSTRSDNLGVGALTVSQVYLIRQIACELGIEVNITIVDSKSSRDPYVSGSDISVVDLDRNFMINPAGFFSLVRGADIVIDVGAGDSFADIYGRRRINRVLFLKYITHLSRTPLILAPQTIGPFSRLISKIMSRVSIDISRVVSVRDDLSARALKDIGYGGELVLASDLALRLPFTPGVFPCRETPRVGVNVSGLLINSGKSGDFGVKLDYPEVIRSVVRYFGEVGAEVHLVPHVLASRPGNVHSEDDWTAGFNLLSGFDHVVEPPRFSSPSDAKSYISGLDFFVGARMHACIAALSAGVAVVPMAYSRKFKGLFESMGYFRTIDCSAVDSETAVRLIVNSFHDRQSLQSECKVALERGLTRLNLYDAALKEAFVGLLSDLAD